MEIKEFHQKLKQHCDDLGGECAQCCFIEYCYSQKRDIYPDFLEQIIDRLAGNVDIGTGTSSPVIQNHHNVCHP